MWDAPAPSERRATAARGTGARRRVARGAWRASAGSASRAEDTAHGATARIATEGGQPSRGGDCASAVLSAVKSKDSSFVREKKIEFPRVVA
jgi:hypothetical protein